MSHADATPSLTRGLTLVPASAIIIAIAIVIGTGVFVKVRVMTCNVGSPGLVLAVYALPGVLTLFGALAGLGMIALGLPVYAHYARRLPPDDPADWLGEESTSAIEADARTGVLV